MRRRNRVLLWELGTDSTGLLWGRLLWNRPYLLSRRPRLLRSRLATLCADWRLLLDLRLWRLLLELWLLELRRLLVDTLSDSRLPVQLWLWLVLLVRHRVSLGAGRRCPANNWRYRSTRNKPGRLLATVRGRKPTI